MPLSSLVLTVGDVGTTLSGQLTHDDTPVVLVGATLKAHVRRPDRTVLDKPAVVDDAGDGTWSLTWDEGDLNTPGIYQVEVEVTFANSTEQTFGPVQFTARQQFA